MLKTTSSGGREGTPPSDWLGEGHRWHRPRCQTTSFGLSPTPGRSIPAASLMPLRARRALRSTSRRTRSRIVCGLGTVGTGVLLARRTAAGAAALRLQLQVQPADLPVQRADLRPEPADVSAGGQVEQMPG